MRTFYYSRHVAQKEPRLLVCLLKSTIDLSALVRAMKPCSIVVVSFSRVITLNKHKQPKNL